MVSTHTTMLTIFVSANSVVCAVFDGLTFLRLVICTFLLLCGVVFDVNCTLGAGYFCVLVSILEPRSWRR